MNSTIRCHGWLTAFQGPIHLTPISHCTPPILHHHRSTSLIMPASACWGHCGSAITRRIQHSTPAGVKLRRQGVKAGATPTQWVETENGAVREQEAAVAVADATQPVLCCSTVTLEPQVSLEGALAALSHAVAGAAEELSGFQSGVVRYEVPIPRNLCTSLEWLQGQTAQPALLPRVYFSPRRSPAANTPGTYAAEQGLHTGATAGVGGAWLWHGPPGSPLHERVMAGMSRFLSSTQPRIRILGASRFDPASVPAPEWLDFGAYCFFLPSLELSEVAECSLLACHVAWDGSGAGEGVRGEEWGAGASSLEDAVQGVLETLQLVQPPVSKTAPSLRISRDESQHTPSLPEWRQLMSCLLDSLVDETCGFHAPTTLDAAAAREEYFTNGQQGLDDLIAALNEGQGVPIGVDGDGAQGLSKVVLARRTKMKLEGELEPLQLVQALQDRDPRAYQLYLQAPGGAVFFGSTPERLYVRSGKCVASEAVAGTRARGAPGQTEADFWLGYELLSSHKDHVEFTQVREWIKSQLSPLCKEVTVEVTKTVIKQATLQHLYGRLSGELSDGVNDAHLLEALHPTPAVCGRPRAAAQQFLRNMESFDRGLYAGPFGWLSGGGAEFAVAIRSALVLQPLDVASSAGPISRSVPRLSLTRLPTIPQPEVHLYAGVGVVQGSDSESEWNELNLKVRMLDRLLTPQPQLSAQPNVNMAWAALAVEELCRMGANMFCIAPGSRGSPLTCAVGRHPRARLNVCVDERSLAFWALGYSRATGRPAVIITSSGTAVANLLPAVVEASCSHVPLLLMTADRPVELRDTSANQTIDQVKIFGGYTRWAQDISPPHPAVPGRSLLTTISTAVRAATGLPPGPVHLNFQFREPLAPIPVPYDESALFHGLDHWQRSQQPFTTTVGGMGGGMGLDVLRGMGTGVVDGNIAEVLQILHSSTRGLLVVGELLSATDVVAVVRIARALGWAVVTDVLSGLRLGNQHADTSGVHFVYHMDHILLGQPDWWEVLRPDVILQIGPRLTSKRLADFLEWSSAATSSFPPAPWLYIAPHTQRQDPKHLISHRLVMPLTTFANMLESTTQTPSSLQPSRINTTPRKLWERVQKQDQQSTALSTVSQARAGMRPAGAAVTSLEQNGARAALAAESLSQSATMGSRLTPNQHSRAQGYGDNVMNGDASSSEGRQGKFSQLLIEGAVFNGRERVESERLGAAESYAEMLLFIDAAVGHEIDNSLAELTSMSEPFVARQLSRLLPCDSGLFLGNSMPIRDMDMYAAPSSSGTRADSNDDGLLRSQPQLPVGVAVASNRGASGIDGVLSTAAGFAEGLGRQVTLVVGDLSFLHDSNGLTLLSSAGSRQPLTVVLINNSGGGIFSFLPIADAVHTDEFTPLWATPQNVDLEGLCRAHGIPHQKVTQPEKLQEALHKAWDLNGHSVVEVVTDRGINVQLHRQIQAAVAAAARAAAATWTASNTTADPARLPLSQPPGSMATSMPVPASSAIHIAAVDLLPFELPLVRPLTTKSAAGVRQGVLVRVRIRVGAGDAGRDTEGVGEVCPLPGLHAESLEEARAQLGLVAATLQGVELDRSVALLGGRMGKWLSTALGFPAESLLPSVRCGLEFALLNAIASAQGLTLTELLQISAFRVSQTSTKLVSTPSPPVRVNALVNAADTPVAVAQAVAAVEQGFTALKVKVGRRDNPVADAHMLCAIREAVPAGTVLRADANRAWTLDQAMHFARAVAPAQLQYVEEACQDPSDLLSLFKDAALPVALDESIDEGLLLPGYTQQCTRERLQELKSCGGLAAVVIKPQVIGGVESAVQIAKWASQSDVQVVISSSFESGVGLASLTQLAAVMDASCGANRENNGTHHGLGTLGWFDLSDDAVQGLRDKSSTSSSERKMHPNLVLRPDMQQQHVNATEYVVSVSRALQGLMQQGCVDTGSLAQTGQSPVHLLPPNSSTSNSCMTSNTGTSDQASDDAQLHSQEHVEEKLYTSKGKTGSDASPQPATLLHSVDAAESRDGITGSDASPQPSALLHSVDAAESRDGITGSGASPQPASSPGVAREDNLQTGAGITGARELPAPSYLPQSSVASISSSGSVFNFNIQRIAPQAQLGSGSSPKFLFIHGFLGDSTEWLPLMSGLSHVGCTCVAVDLPGHGLTRVALSQQDGTCGQVHQWEGEPRAGQAHEGESSAACTTESEGSAASSGDDGERSVGDEGSYSVESTAAALATLVEQEGLQGCIVVGYSLGARVALSLAAHHPSLISHLVLISGTPGIPSTSQRAQRAARDDSLAQALRCHGVSTFGRQWYEQPMWASLQSHPRGKDIIRKRLRRAEMGPGSHRLAQSLERLSTGRMVPLWADLAALQVPTHLVVGQLDTKFVRINRKMLRYLTQGTRQNAEGAHASQSSGELTSTSMTAADIPNRGRDIPDRERDIPELAAESSSAAAAVSTSAVSSASDAFTVTTDGAGNGMDTDGVAAKKVGSSGRELCDGAECERDGMGASVQHDMQTVAGCGHAVHVERADVVLDYLVKLVTADRA